MSSDLSFLIQNENEVQVDQSYLQKYQNQPTKLQKPPTKKSDQYQTPKKQIKLKKKMTEIETSKKKKFNVKSYTSQHFPQFQPHNKKAIITQQRKSQQSLSPSSEDNSKYFEMIENRIQQLLSNQKTAQEQITAGLFEVKNMIQSNEDCDKNVFGMMEKTRQEVKKTQKGIGQILNLIQKHSQMAKINQELLN